MNPLIPNVWIFQTFDPLPWGQFGELHLAVSLNAFCPKWGWGAGDCDGEWEFIAHFGLN